jgi:hypothetical protein
MMILHLSAADRLELTPAQIQAIADLARRAAQSQGLLFLMPQAE